MTRHEFEQQYAESSGITIAILRKLGLYAIPCNCGEEGCLGYQMRNLSNLLTP